MSSLKFNGEHYRDKTAEKAIKKIERREKKRIAKAISEVKKVLLMNGFSLVGRIRIMDIKTGAIHE